MAAGGMVWLPAVPLQGHRSEIFATQECPLQRIKGQREGGFLWVPPRHLKTSSADFKHEISIAGTSEADKIKPLDHVSGSWAWAESRGKLKKAQSRSK